MKVKSQIPDTSGSATYKSGLKTDTVKIYTNDSLKIDSPSEVKVQSIFKDSKYLTNRIDPHSRNMVNQDWIIVHLVVVFALLAWVRIFYRKRFGQMLVSFFGERYQGILLREGNIFRERISIPLVLNFFVVQSLFIYLLIINNVDTGRLEYGGFKLFALIILILIMLWIIKNIAILLTGYIFQNPILLNDYLLIHFIFDINLGLYLFPVVILSAYVSPSVAVYVGIPLWFIVFVYRIFRQLFTTFGYTKFSLFNRILYLCTFEIVPILVLIKLILSYLS